MFIFIKSFLVKVTIKGKIRTFELSVVSNELYTCMRVVIVRRFLSERISDLLFL